MLAYMTPAGLRTGQLQTGQTDWSIGLGTAGLGSLVVTGLALLLAYQFFFKPRLSRTYAARTALTKAEKERMATLELENKELSRLVDEFVCLGDSVGKRVGASCGNGR